MLAIFAKDALTETPAIPTDLMNYVLYIRISFAGVHIEFFSAATASLNHIEIFSIAFLVTRMPISLALTGLAIALLLCRIFQFINHLIDRARYPSKRKNRGNDASHASRTKDHQNFAHN
jgi:hypothetical protein